MMWFLLGVVLAFLVATFGSGVALAWFRGKEGADRAGRCAVFLFGTGIVLVDLTLLNVLLNGGFSGGLSAFLFTLVGLKVSTLLLVSTIEPAVRTVAARQ